MLALVKAFLKAGVLTETRQPRGQPTPARRKEASCPRCWPTSPCRVLDEHLHGPWKPGGTMGTASRRARRRAKGLPNWRIVRYADDFVVLVHGTRDDVESPARRHR